MSLGSFGSFGGGDGGGRKEKTLAKNKHYDDTWYMHLLYSVQRAESITDIKPGDIIVLHRGMYLHFAVVVRVGDPGESDVTAIDLHADDLMSQGVIGERVFNLDEEIWVLQVPEEDSYPREQVVARAWSRVGLEDYALVTNNCEHFALWCKTGAGSSRQVAVAGLATLAGVGGLVLGAATIVKTLLTGRSRQDEHPV